MKLDLFLIFIFVPPQNREPFNSISVKTTEIKHFQGKQLTLKPKK